MDRLHWIQQLSEIIDEKNATEFAAYFTDEGIFRIGNQPSVKGKNSINQYCTDFLKLLRSCCHETVAVDECRNCVTWQGKVTYVRLDGRCVYLPFCNVLRFEDERICEYMVYIDNSPLFAA